MSTVVRTMCPMNCHPTLCGMLVEIEDGRVLSVKGDPDNPDSQGFLCVRGQASREIIGNPERLLHHMVRNRRGGDWRGASWAEVLDRIAERMREAGRLAVATWTGHGAAANNYGMRLTGNLVRRFANLYGCQTWGSQMICWGLGGFGLGLTGVLETSTKEDMGAHANLIVLWGANLASQPNTARHVAAARRRGAPSPAYPRSPATSACPEAGSARATARPRTDTGWPASRPTAGGRPATTSSTRCPESRKRSSRDASA